MTPIITFVASIYLFLSCYEIENTTLSMHKRSETTFISTRPNNFDTTMFICDTIYAGKNYRILLSTFDTFTSDETKFNTIFTFSSYEKGNSVELFKDSIYNTVHSVEFEDYNNDSVKDILIQSYSDGRSNWTYYLYLVDTVKNKLQKIKNFEQIKNPKWNSGYCVIENYVLSGLNWASFYEIDFDSIKQFDIYIQDDLRNTRKFSRDYNKALKKIRALQQNNR